MNLYNENGLNINAIYTDFWEILGNYLSSDDIYSFALTCKQAWKACNRNSLKQKMSYPLSMPYRLTYDQRSTIRNMEINPNQRFKLIRGEVGSGKTIVSISYAIRNYISENNSSKIVMVGPPSLIKMWWSTLEKYFGISPCVLHGTNTKYNPKTDWSKKPDQKFILTSYVLLGHHYHLDWFDPKTDILIIDEAHHRVAAPHHSFKETIGLSATTTTKKGVASGIGNILRGLDLEIDDCTYDLKKDILGKKLPPVEYHSYQLKCENNVSNRCKNLIEYTKNGEMDLMSINKICKNLSHPLVYDLEDTFTGGYIMVGRKTLRVDSGNMVNYHQIYLELSTQYPDLTVKQRKKKMEDLSTFDITKTEYPKYLQAYHIVKWANDRNEKVVLFDMSIEHLPFLHKFFIHYGLNSYIFSTHYSTTDRQRQLQKFKDDKKPGVLMSSINMLGEGQNVTESNHVIFFTQCPDPVKYYQAVGRCWRYPQKKKVHVHLIFSTLFDRKVYEHACGTTNLKNEPWLELLSQ